jgi:hypothetical protein
MAASSKPVQTKTRSLKRIYVDAFSRPLDPAKAPKAARLHRPVPADPRR